MLKINLQKLILLIFSLSIFFILQITPLYAQDYGPSLDLNAAKSYDFDYFDFSKFQYTGPIISWEKLLQNVDEKTQQTYSSKDDYDHFESSKPIQDLYPLITGTVILDTSINPDLFKKILADEEITNTIKPLILGQWRSKKELYNCNNSDFYFNIYKIYANITNSKNIDNNKSYHFITDVNLQYYQCLNDHFRIILDTIEMASNKEYKFNWAVINKSLQFVAGMKKETDDSTSQTNDYWNSNFKDTTTDKTKADLLLSDESKEMASGACYEANPSGEKNRCANVISKNCPNKTASGKGKMHFLYGITCENLNTLIKDKNYKAKIEDKVGGKLTDSKKPVKEKEEIKVKIQVPFADIKDGILLHDYINEIYKYLVSLGLFIAGFMLVLGGLQYIGQQPANGKKNIQNAVIGIILLTGSYTLLQVINPNTLDLKDITNIKEVERMTMGRDVDLSDVDIPDNKLNDQFDPKIEVKEDWCFPVKKSHVKTSKFKEALNYTSSLSFGYNRTNPNKTSHKKYPNTTICHAGLDILTKYNTTAGVDNKTKADREGEGTVIAIADGKVLINGNNFTTCGYGGPKPFKVGSIIIDHGDFVIRYGEVNNNSKTDLKKDDKVKAGQVLGKATYCGMLHLELFDKGSWSGGNWYPNYRFIKSDTISCLKKTMTVDFKKDASKYCTDGSCQKNWQHLKNLQDPTNFLKELYQKAQPSHCGNR